MAARGEEGKVERSGREAGDEQERPSPAPEQGRQEEEREEFRRDRRAERDPRGLHPPSILERQGQQDEGRRG